MPPSDPDSKHYHHGNLKEALVTTYLSLLAHAQPETISLRKLAGELGVAPTAVYNHFRNKEALNVAVKTRCLEHFADYLDAATQLPAPAKERITALGKAYFDYAQVHPQYFKLLMGENVPDDLVTPELMAASMRAEAALRRTVLDLLNEHDIPTSQYNEGLGSFACWSIAHGVTLLSAKRVNNVACMEGRWPETFMLSNAEQVHQSFDAMTEVLVAGILAAAKR